MEKIYQMDASQSFEPLSKEYRPYHKDHKFCTVCGEHMQFEITEQDPKFSGYSGNRIYNLVEFCPVDRGHDMFTVMELYRYRGDSKLYKNDFEDPQTYIENTKRRL